MSKSDQNLTINQDLLNSYIENLINECKQDCVPLRIRDIYNKFDKKNPLLVRREYTKGDQRMDPSAFGSNVVIGIIYDNHGNPVEIYQTDEQGKVSYITSNFQSSNEEHNDPNKVKELLENVSKIVAPKTNEYHEISQTQEKPHTTSKVMSKETKHNRLPDRDHEK